MNACLAVLGRLENSAFHLHITSFQAQEMGHAV